MKKRTHSALVISLVAAIVAGGIFLVYRHIQNGIVPGYEFLPASSSVSTGTQTISGDGYVFGIPAGWYVEQGSKNVIAAYPDHYPATSTLYEAAVACKIEMSVFPYSQSTSAADWISDHIAADPSLAVVEQSSEDVVINGGIGMKWSGLIDDAPMTLVYAFNKEHAYEIAPSVVNGKILGNAECSNALDTFLSHLTIR